MHAAWCCLVLPLLAGHVGAIGSSFGYSSALRCASADFIHCYAAGGTPIHPREHLLAVSAPSLPVDASRVCFVFLVAAFVFITFFAIVVCALAQLILSHSLLLYLPLSLYFTLSCSFYICLYAARGSAAKGETVFDCAFT